MIRLPRIRITGIADKLAADGLENAKPFVTEKGTHAAVYVNSESPHYLLIENAFPNGHPALEQCGVIITRRDIVEKSAMMKVSTCMNPMDTALGVFGCMLGYTRISDEMKDTELVNLITRLSEQEAMPMVAEPGVIDPEAPARGSRRTLSEPVPAGFPAAYRNRYLA